MRLNFLLDENILYHAIRGVDLHDQPDPTATRLVLTIIKVCHSLVIHNDLRLRYINILGGLKSERPRHLPPFDLFKQVMERADKRTFEYESLPALPEGCADIPRKDQYLVRAALISRPLFVTADGPLYDALRRHPELEIEVLRPHEALDRAQSTAAD